MLLPLLQIASIAALTICLYRWKVGSSRRNAQSWDSIVARLRMDNCTRSLGDQSIWNGNLNVTPEEKWRLIQGVHGLWTMYENARVMLEMAEYAFGQATESISVNMTRAAAMYSEMAARTAELLAANGREMAPNFVAAM
jgi:hypothetical protein